MNYRATRKLQTVSYMPAWLLRAQGKLGTITGTISLGIGLLAWLEMDFAYCLAYNIHLSEEFVPIGSWAFFLAPLAFLGGLTTIGCGAWRLGTISIYVSLGALVAVSHTLYSPANIAFFMLTFPLFFFFLPFLISPLHPLYNPWIAAVLAAFLFITWVVGKRRNPTN